MPFDTAKNPDGIDITPSLVSTDDIPIDSWDKWAPRNLARSDQPLASEGTLNDANYWDSTSTGAGSIGIFNPSSDIHANSNSGSGSTAEVRLRYDTTHPEVFAISNVTLYDIDWWWYARVKIKAGSDQREDYYNFGNRIHNSEKGFGFKLASDNLQGVVHDGTSETTSSTIVSSPGTGLRTLLAHFTAGGSVEFWVDDLSGSPDATISSGLPSGSKPNRIYTDFHVDNLSNNVNRRITVGEVRIGGSA